MYFVSLILHTECVRARERQAINHTDRWRSRRWAVGMKWGRRGTVSSRAARCQVQPSCSRGGPSRSDPGSRARRPHSPGNQSLIGHSGQVSCVRSGPSARRAPGRPKDTSDLMSPLYRSRQSSSPPPDAPLLYRINRQNNYWYFYDADDNGKKILINMSAYYSLCINKTEQFLIKRW